MKEKGYIKIKNKDNKAWILPQKQLSLALNLYQPSSHKGILLKQYLPVCMKIHLLNWLIKKMLCIQECDLEVPTKVIDILKELFKNNEIEFAYFAGTPSKHQKGTIQIFDNNRILGYAKFSNVEDIQVLFYEEKKFLEWLSECGVKDVPKCLLCEEIRGGTTVFVQDTQKTQESKIFQELSDLHINFIREFCDKTQVSCDYGATNYFEMIEKFKRNLTVLDDLGIESKVVSRAIMIVEDELASEKEFSAFHGDFTPWNTFVESNHLYVFDFEYARKTYPKYLDIFHFFTQTLVFGKNKNANQIMLLFEREFVSTKYEGLLENPYMSYLQYLISVIAFYVQRDKGAFRQECINNLRIWQELIQIILKRMEVTDCCENDS